MTTDLENAQANLEFYTTVAPLELEFEEARATKEDDPERWLAAKQAFEEQRTFYRQIGEYLKASEEAATIAAAAAEATVEVAAPSTTEGS